MDTDGALPRAWMLLTFGAEREWGGNAGYDDDPTARYRYDNFVPNHKQVESGDVAVLRDRGGLIGVARIGHISAAPGAKTRYRCPVTGCSTGDLKRRRTRRPEFRCKAGHEFDRPVEDEVPCVAYEAELRGFTPTPGALTLEELRGACPRFADMLAMQEIDLASVWARLVATNSAVTRLLAASSHDRSSATLAGAVEEAAQDDPAIWQPVARRIRRGQGRFRQELVLAYGGQCAITGHGPDTVLEAAHIAPHASTGRNASTNGVLLRADLHALFDDGLLAIDPVTRTVAVHQDLAGTPYGQLANQRLRARLDGRVPDQGALTLRWEEFRRCNTSG